MSYSPLALGFGIAICIALIFLLVRRLYHGRVRRVPPWDCGFPAQTARMQDTAEGFGQPIRHVFGVLFRIRRRLPAAGDPAPEYALELSDRFWHGLYVPIQIGVETLARWTGVLQQGRISLYLLYSFATLLILLGFVL